MPEVEASRDSDSEVSAVSSPPGWPTLCAVGKLLVSLSTPLQLQSPQHGWPQTVPTRRSSALRWTGEFTGYAGPTAYQ